ncbi:MAG: hypothetical protein OEW27_19140 [Aquincola sp.]|nr:hypothetical protein [Aquincola sp.]
MRILRLIVVLAALCGLAAAYVWVASQWSYSSGERAGWVQKFSHKGWICKTWEGELALVSLPGSSVEKFLFTTHDQATARAIQDAMGKRVTLHYEEKVGLPTSCFGDTRHFVTRVTVNPDIPIGPGVSLPTGPAASPQAAPSAPASVASPQAAPSSPASAASI